ncbi:hypothetical protein PT974_09980 [Cladobotryum mycophilum]|uniref:Isopenicillin N synthase-like Fe(2+) 2OG dioxygenase domain-containing protein n=1 Tax=Cladobotryum mycophilum TaxID=491253 RepID=A0ABR0S8K1_9HYPO
MFDLTADTFALDQSILGSHAYNPPRDLTGYKQKGKLKTDDSKTDCMELYSINQDDMLGNSPLRKNVGPIEAKRTDVVQFIRHAHSVADVILTQLDIQLGLQPGILSSLSPLDQMSETSVRLLLAQSQSDPQYDCITLGGHTDIGTIALLFNVPKPGCVIVNIGDTIAEWTGGLLRSSLHRVIMAPGEQASVARQSVAYLVRPRNSASMRRLKGGLIPPVEEEDDETRQVNEWVAWRAKQIIFGELKPQTRGGKPIISMQTAA